MSDVETRIEEKIDRILEKLGIADESHGEAPAPDPGGQFPAEALGLRGWKITIPDGDGTRDVKQPALRTFTDEHFFLDPTGDGAVFRVHHGEGTTDHSPNPRSELREMKADGSQEITWDATSGTHTLTVTGQVNRLTRVKPHVVLAQIHGGDDDVTVFRLEKNKLWITRGNTAHGHLVTDDFALGKRYTLGMEARNGTVRYWYQGVPVDFTLPVTDESTFFKAGNYLQSNPESAPGESTAEYSEVVIHELKVAHGS